jgi:hypothetical protein
MGSGSSSRWLGSGTPTTLRERLRQAEESARNELFDAEVDRVIGQTLAGHNDRDSDAIGRALEQIITALGKEFEVAIDLRFGGSVSKNTYVNGLSDVDALVLIHRDDVTGKTPQEIRSLFAECLRARFGRDSVTEGHLAVTVTIENNQIQLLPAVRQGDGYKIASTRGSDWSNIRPRVFSEMLTQLNRQMGGKLVPVIKLSKAIVGKLPEHRQLTGYHTEVLAVSIFRDYSGPRTPKAMLRYFFDRLPGAVRTPRRDVTGQSVYLDQYLGSADSLSRKTVADAMERIARSIRNADGAQSITMWNEILASE